MKPTKNITIFTACEFFMRRLRCSSTFVSVNRAPTALDHLERNIMKIARLASAAALMLTFASANIALASATSTHAGTSTAFFPPPDPQPKSGPKPGPTVPPRPPLTLSAI